MSFASRRPLVVAATLGLLAVTAVTAHAFEFFHADELERTIEERVGDEVMTVDLLVDIWGEDNQDIDGHLRFDTERFRCIVPNTQAEAIAYLREVAEARKKGDTTLPLLALYGKVDRTELWGKVKGGQSEGVVAEQIVILIDKIEKPRKRFFEEGHLGLPTPPLPPGEE